MLFAHLPHFVSFVPFGSNSLESILKRREQRKRSGAVRIAVVRIVSVRVLRVETTRLVAFC